MSDWHMEFRPWYENQIECIVIWMGNWTNETLQRPNSAGFGITKLDAFMDMLDKITERYPDVVPPVFPDHEKESG